MSTTDPGTATAAAMPRKRSVDETDIGSAADAAPAQSSPETLRSKRSKREGIQRRFLEWVRKFSGISGLENVDLRISDVPGAGFGVYARETLGPGALVIRVPHRSVLNATKALQSTVGKVAREIDPNCTDEFVLVLWVAVGRCDPRHPFFAYLTSLQVSPRPCLICPV